MRPSTAINAGLVMVGSGSILFAFAEAPELSAAGLAAMVLGCGVALGGFLARR